MQRNNKLVSKIIYGRGTFNQLDEIMKERRTDESSFIVYIVDEVFREKELFQRIALKDNDLLLWANVETEPKTIYIDELTNIVKNYNAQLPVGVIGMGGGSTMDIAKAVSLMLTNSGSAADYQGWDLIKNPAVYHVGVPTLSGTGAEVSRTAVLTGPVKKLGINSDFTLFDQIILDPDLISDAPDEQRFYTAMDCYVHCGESLTGTFINEFARAYSDKALTLLQEIFSGNISREKADEKLMIASMFGGFSIAYSQVGVCHALSYGLSYVLGYRHGIGNCIVFNSLDDYYDKYVDEFRQMLIRNNITLPSNICRDISEEQMEKMIDVSLVLEPLWENALGKNWKDKINRNKIKDLYLRM
ncbi:MAG: 3-deoxy-alpha-D-manno-octulosonate 8-oxidase [Bacteroidota bacterium]|nr:3-deoxy-alpha-D-manno-octulosonate 8-oxidase [Bacteroidota bacterium]